MACCSGVLETQFLRAHRHWRSQRKLEPSLGFPGLRYVLLHSLSHALIRQFSVECGYAAASLKERIYSSTPDDEEAMAGILIYTAAPDSEGTLGGLVTLGETANLEQHLDQALERLEICSSDPLCAETQPEQAFLSLHGAACHNCLFLPETWCREAIGTWTGRCWCPRWSAPSSRSSAHDRPRSVPEVGGGVAR